MKPRAPYNILFIMTDQLAYNALGCVNGAIQTPNIDRICKEGTRFSRCYSNAPLCLPARACLATGRYPSELNVMDNTALGISEQDETWMRRIRNAGYETSLFGKVHLHRFPRDMRDIRECTQNNGYQIVDELPGPRTYGLIWSSYYDYLQERGQLDVYRADMESRYRFGPVYTSRPTSLKTEDYADIYIANRALEYLEHVPGDKPWFCTVGFGGPHDPWDTPQEYCDLYKDVTPPLPLKRPVSVNPNRARGVFDELLNGKYDPCLTEDILQMTPEDIAALRRSYFGHVTLIDDQVGRIAACLERRNMLNNTIIVVASDHGEQNGDYGLLFKQTFFESSVRVPLAIRTPDENGGIGPQVIEAPVELMDIGVTLCDILGLDASLGHAQSLLPLMYGENACKDPVISQLFGETMILADEKKAVFNRDGEIYLLFDLHSDPSESRNLAGVPRYRTLESKMKNVFEMKKLEWHGVIG